MKAFSIAVAVTLVLAFVSVLESATVPLGGQVEEVEEVKGWRRWRKHQQLQLLNVQDCCRILDDCRPFEAEEAEPSRSVSLVLQLLSQPEGLWLLLQVLVPHVKVQVPHLKVVVPHFKVLVPQVRLKV
ncbi:unnamed protein product [Gadus morhua 'NCC']